MDISILNVCRTVEHHAQYFIHMPTSKLCLSLLFRSIQSIDIKFWPPKHLNVPVMRPGSVLHTLYSTLLMEMLCFELKTLSFNFVTLISVQTGLVSLFVVLWGTLQCINGHQKACNYLQDLVSCVLYMYCF